MITPEVESAIRCNLCSQLNITINSFRAFSVGGGSINDTYRLHINDKLQVFCKINSLKKYPLLFEKEKRGMEMIRNKNVIRVPKILCCFNTDQYQVLIMEWIEQGLKTEKFWKVFGEQLAQLHYGTNSFFGLEEDNYMGALTQSNKAHASWVDFLLDERFIPQVRLALENKLLEPVQARKFEDLFKVLQDIFPVEQPSFVHGDLWSGNFLADKNENPVLIDPAVYWGNRNMDLGMTTLFGGFDKSFYEAYQHHILFQKNFYQQWQICNLYPLLIHLNLFGKTYLADIVNTIKQY
ncbi:MAG: fructosamine kinase family protein [Bacteroidetes bacterium]|nr:fructosamine kinase family protein [Bacteroidota bacterium]